MHIELPYIYSQDNFFPNLKFDSTKSIESPWHWSRWQKIACVSVVTAIQSQTFHSITVLQACWSDSITWSFALQILWWMKQWNPSILQAITKHGWWPRPKHYPSGIAITILWPVYGWWSLSQPHSTVIRLAVVTAECRNIQSDIHTSLRVIICSLHPGILSILLQPELLGSYVWDQFILSWVELSAMWPFHLCS